MSAVASFVGKIFLNGNDVTHSSLLNQIQEKKATCSKPTKRKKNVKDSVQTLRAKANTQSQTRKARRSLSPDDDEDDP